MATEMAEPPIQTILVLREILIGASTETAFSALMQELGPAGQMPDGKPMPMVIEPWPGGRWYRDLGANAGHFWGHVQVFKPPGLLELCGPMFLSYPVANHVQYRLTAEGDGTRLQLVHRAFGQIPPEVRERVDGGWEFKLKQVRAIAERLKTER